MEGGRWQDNHILFAFRVLFHHTSIIGFTFISITMALANRMNHQLSFRFVMMMTYNIYVIAYKVGNLNSMCEMYVQTYTWADIIYLASYLCFSLFETIRRTHCLNLFCALIISHMTGPLSNINFKKISYLTTLKKIMGIATSLQMCANNNVEASKHVGCIKFMQKICTLIALCKELAMRFSKSFWGYFQF